MPEALLVLAGQQAGVFTMMQAVQAGVSRRALESSLRAGLCVRLRPGVFAVSEHMQRSTRYDHAARVAAAQFRIKRRTLAGSESALHLHSVELLRPPPLVQLTSDGGKPHDYEGVRLTVAALPEEHVDPAPRYGVSVVTAARGVIDLARQRPFVEGVIAVDSALHLGKTTSKDLRLVMNDCQDWPGALMAQRVIDFADPRCESALESASRVMFAVHSLPAPRSQVWIRLDDGDDVRVDFYWAEHGVIGEADGKSKYRKGVAEGGDPVELLWAEKRRQEALEAMGFIVVRWGWVDVFRTPTRTVARLESAFARGLAGH